MNVYDSAHNLAKAIKNSDEYTDYIAAKEKLDASEGLKNAFEDFQKRESEMQMSIIGGNEPDDNEIETLNSLYGVLSKDPLGSEYLQAESRYRQMLDDMSRILADAMQI
ncbi:MAG: YlbF family regulator [Peptostreptococcaceae bacterium]|nr:YlbF family regulator [Peptostreptococcaceae bacterium]